MWDILMSNLALFEYSSQRVHPTTCHTVSMFLQIYLLECQFCKGVKMGCKWRSPLPPVFHSFGASVGKEDWRWRPTVLLVRFTHFLWFALVLKRQKLVYEMGKLQQTQGCSSQFCPKAQRNPSKTSQVAFHHKKILFGSSSESEVL